MTTPSPDAVALALRIGTAIGPAARATTLDQELRAAVASIRAVFAAAACSVAVLQPDGETLRFVAADGAGAESVVGIELGLERGIAGWVAMTGQAIVVADVRADPRFARDVAESTRYVPKSIMAAPLLRRDGEAIGVVEVLDPTTDAAGTGRDLDVLSALGAQLAAVAELATRFDRLGAMVVAGITGSADDAAVAERIVAASGEDDAPLKAIASSVAALAAIGPRGSHLVQQVLDAVRLFAAGRR